MQGSVYFKLMSWGNIGGFLFSVVVTGERGRWEWKLDSFWAAFPSVLPEVSLSCSSLQIQFLQARFALACVVATAFLRYVEPWKLVGRKIISNKESLNTWLMSSPSMLVHVQKTSTAALSSSPLSLETETWNTLSFCSEPSGKGESLVELQSLCWRAGQ